MILLWSIFILFWACLTLGLSFLAAKQFQRLDRVIPLDAQEDLPLISIIIPACNEADHIAETCRTLCCQTYPNCEIILINDRSTDTTQEIMEEIAGREQNVKVIRINDLPDGWLGKNHAMYHGAQEARGEYLLFTDADVHFEPSTLSRAMHYIQNNRVAHLSLIFRSTVHGGLLNAAIVEALTGLLLILRPWKVGRPGSKYFMGVGAFNLVQANVYHQVGGHQRHPMHPIDDLILGKTLWKQGFSQACLRGENFISVAWYESVQEMIRGLMKNSFAFLNFSLPWVGVATIFIVLFQILPLLALPALRGIPLLVCIGALIAQVGTYLVNARSMQIAARHWPYSLIAPALLLYILLRATWCTYLHQGIVWRGTLYRLQDLRNIEPILTLEWLIRR